MGGVNEHNPLLKGPLFICNVWMHLIILIVLNSSFQASINLSSGFESGFSLWQL